MAEAPDHLDNDEQDAFYAGVRAFRWDNATKRNPYSGNDRAAFDLGWNAAATEGNPSRTGEHIRVQGLIKFASPGDFGGFHYKVVDQRGATYSLYTDTEPCDWTVGASVEFEAVIAFSNGLTFDVRDVREIAAA